MSVELYDSQHPQAAKWLLPDGTVTYKLPVMGASGGGGGTDDHAELLNLDYAHSGHTGFASQTDLAAIAGSAPEIGAMVSHEFSPGLRLYHTSYGNVHHYWIEGEATSPKSLQGYIATPAHFPELALFEGNRISVLIMAYRQAIGSGGPPQFEFNVLTISKKGIMVIPFQGNVFNCIDGDQYYSGTSITFNHALILRTQN